jgi:uncharacterized protein (TIGR02001 family)
LGLAIGATIAVTAAPAAAQVGAAVSIFSDERFRGYSLSQERPVAILDLSYDAPSGLYGVVSGSVVAARDEGVRPLGLQLNGGYAKRLNSVLTFDVGATHSTYSHYSGIGGARSYTEVYAGIGGRSVSARLSVSPDYFGAGSTVHGEVNGHFSLAKDLSVAGDLGLLVLLGHGYSSHPVYDARLGVDRTFGRFSLHAAVTSRGKSRAFYSGRWSSRNAFIVGISYGL